jgi:hypothetical protein
LTKETNNIFEDKPVKKPAEIKSLSIIKNTGFLQKEEDIVMKQEFEDKLDYLLKKLDIIYDITK